MHFVGEGSKYSQTNQFHAKSLFMNQTAVSYNSSTIITMDYARIYRYKDKGMS